MQGDCQLYLRTNKKHKQQNPTPDVKKATEVAFSCSKHCLSASAGPPHAHRIAPTETIPLSRLKTNVPCIEVSFHGGLETDAVEVLQPVRHVGQHEPCIGVRQEVVDGVPRAE